MSEQSTTLSHYGVPGMKWGVRKERTKGSESSRKSSRTSTKPGWTIDKDGGIEIDQGATISRVVRNHAGLFGGTGADWQSGRPVYAAFKKIDAVSYEHNFGRAKGLLVKEASTVQKFTPKTKLKAPGPKEASEIFYKLARTDPQFRAGLESGLNGVARLNLKKNIENPGTKQAYDGYSLALDGANYSDRFKNTNAKYFAAVKKAGYNMLVDPSDALADFDTPVIILDGKNSLMLKTQYLVDKHSQEKVRNLYKSEAAKAGRTYLEKLGYA